MSDSVDTSSRALLNRRTFLYSSAATAGAVIIAACSGGGGGGNGPGTKPGNNSNNAAAGGKGSATKPLPKPAKFQESPLLKQQADAGTIPALAERLPENPYVVPHKWVQPGKYGGNLLMISPKATGGPVDASNKEFFYGHSPLRYLNDGLNIGPGLAESWESNADATEWTLHFRKGLKWSDGKPWTTADIMFWWEDLVINPDHSEVPPDEARSGKGTLAKFKAVDDTTLTLTFDAPAPLTADRLAMWVNGAIGNGPWWMAPRHYAEQFHPKYNKKIGKNWAEQGGLFEQKVDWSRNPECPTMTGYRAKKIVEGRNIVYERNPFYYAVMPNGDQLPYIDEINTTVVQSPEVGKLSATQGKVDLVLGQFNTIGLQDISTMKGAEKTSQLGVTLWDGGSGTSSIFFFNYDHKDPKWRTLIRNPKFRQALSIAVNRKEIQKALYFNTGEITTGTLSPKAKEYLVNDEGKATYKLWRDSFVKHDPEKAKQMLDELGVKDKNGDGFREFPDGSKLEIQLEYPADTDVEHKHKNSYLVTDWKAIGIKATPNPVAPEAIGDKWNAGLLDTTTAWEVGDGPNHLVYPQWLVPLEPTRWAPLEGQMYNVRGTPQEHQQKNVDPYKRNPPRMDPDPKGPIKKLWDLYDQSKVEPDEMGRDRLVWEMIKIHATDGPFFQGCVANTPRVVLSHHDLKNIPQKANLALGGLANPWIHPTPAVYDPETFFWTNPDQHKV